MEVRFHRRVQADVKAPATAMRYLLDRAGLTVGCVGSLAIAGLFAGLAVARPEIHRAITVAPALVFAAAGFLCGYRAFSPDEWFAARAYREEAWMSRHPVLGSFCVLLALVSFVWEVIRVLNRLGFL